MAQAGQEPAQEVLLVSDQTPQTLRMDRKQSFYLVVVIQCQLCVLVDPSMLLQLGLIAFFNGI